MRLVLGEEAVGEFHGGVSGGEFGGVDGAGDEHDGLAFEEELLGLGGAGLARVGQFLLDGEVAVQMLQGLRRSDDRGDERPAFGAFAEFLDAYAVAGFGQFLEVGNGLVPIEHGAVGADLMAEVALRCRNRGAHGPCRGEKKNE